MFYRDVILNVLRQFPEGLSIRQLFELLQGSISRRTLQRQLGMLATKRAIVRLGKGPSTRYRAPQLFGGERPLVDRIADISEPYDTYVPISEEGREIREYVRQPLGARTPVAFDRSLLDEYLPNQSWYLDPVTRERLHRIGSTGNETQPAGTYGRAVLDRLLIDLSWSSSRLEGNTYTRLDTQHLIESGRAATGHDAIEAQMILNHKRAIELLVEDAEDISFNSYTFLNLHGLLSEDLMPDPSSSGRLRERSVEIAGSVYRPSAVPQVIAETFETLLAKAEAVSDPLEQAFFALVHLPYLQPFEDVNKRVARLGANIPLIKANLCPLTFLDVPEKAYIDATLGVYEMGRVELLRDLFVWAYERSTQQYIQIKRTLAAPNPFRTRYRQQLHEFIGSIVKEQHKTGLRQRAEHHAANHLPPEDRAQFVAMVLDDLKRLHIGVIARYRIRPSEFEKWKAL